MDTSSNSRNIYLATSAIAIIFAPASAQAQERARVDEIVVTAQKREQNQQDIPVAVATYGAELIKNSGIRDIKDLIAVAPGLMVTSTASEASTTVRIRGIGTVGDNTGLESSAGIFIDGVYRSRNSVGFGDLGEIERIELLRGPQGTLFGKNTSAGALNVTTKGPEYEPSYGFEATASNFGGYGGAVFATGPLNDNETAAFRLYAAKRKRNGYVRNADPSGGDSFDQDVITLRGQIELRPNDNFKLNLIGDYSQRDENCCAGVPISVGTSSLLVNALGTGGYPVNTDATTPRALPRDAFTAYYNRGIGQKIDEKGVSAQLEWQTELVDITSITAYRNWKNVSGQDVDFTNADIFYRPDDGGFGNEFTTFTQELRFAGSRGKLDWLFGGFFMDEQLQRRDTIRFGEDYEAYLGFLLSGGTNAQAIADFTGIITGAPGTQVIPFGSNLPQDQGQLQDVYDHSAQTFALFTHNTVQLTERFSVTGGLRWTNEEKSVNATFSTNAPGCALYEGIFGADPVGGAIAAGAGSVAPVVGLVCLPWARSGLDGAARAQKISSSEFSGTAKAAFRINDDAMIYASYARGFKAGGLNLDRKFDPGQTSGTLAAWDTRFAPETVDTFEAGLKTESFDNSLLANITVFSSRFHDFQLNTFNGTSFIVDSVPQVKSDGVELELLFLPDIDGLTLQGGITYADTRYGTLAGTPANLSGQQMSLSPKWYGTAAITYEHPLADNLVWRVHVDGRAVSSYNTGSDLDAVKQQDGFATFNARFAIAQVDDNWSLELWGRNIFDTTYMQVAFDTPLGGSSAFSMFPGAPRIWGASLRGKF
ncbi:TonB-dependent receptor [hydrothermal vent metagenome]|uniref:TonB-dependent receptor n=1 Tax=hydrothermal vent metagenome TaxID=652676 RepID=A0A3B0RSE2_9ZZZZ